jgi:hypothetical protein
MSEYDGYGDGADTGDAGDGYDLSQIDFYDLPDDHWIRDPGWVEFAHNFVTCLREDPSRIEGWYDAFAKDTGLRGLVEAVEAAASEAPKRSVLAEANEAARAAMAASRGVEGSWLRKHR